MVRPGYIRVNYSDDTNIEFTIDGELLEELAQMYGVSRLPFPNIDKEKFVIGKIIQGMKNTVGSYVEEKVVNQSLADLKANAKTQADSLAASLMINS